MNLESNELTLYFIPSPYGLDWSTPSSITKTTILNHLTLKNRNIGHVIVEVKHELNQVFTGMTGNVKSSKKLLLRDGIGLGMLYYNYPGRLEDHESLKSELNDQAKDKRLNFVTFKISGTTAKRLITYLQEFKARGYSSHYGLPNRPLHGEGSGCSAFGISFMEVAGLLDDEFKQAWSYDLLVPEKVIGAPISDKKVNVFKVLKTKKWASESEPHRKIFFWDPDTMFKWVEKKIKEQGPYEVITKEGAKGLCFNRENVSAPSTSYWNS